MVFLRLTIKKVYNYFEEPEEKLFFSKMYKIIAYLISLFIVMFTLGISPNNLVIFLGLITTGLAFAIRDILLSYFSWTILLRKKPFKIGDYIKLGDDQGRVKHIGTFFVILDPTPEFPEDYIRIPTKLFLEKSIINYGKNNFHERITFQLSNFPKNKQKLTNLLEKEISKRIKEKNTILIIIDLEKEKLYLRVEYLINFEEKDKTRYELIEVIYKIFKKHIFISKGPQLINS